MMQGLSEASLLPMALDSTHGFASAASSQTGTLGAKDLRTRVIEQPITCFSKKICSAEKVIHPEEVDERADRTTLRLPNQCGVRAGYVSNACTGTASQGDGGGTRLS